MLTHATDYFLDIADDDVAALRRSVDPVTFSGPGDEHFEVQAFLVLHREQARLVCHAALRCRALKRPVVFAVTAASPVALLEVGSAQLEQLGFELRDVNLNLSPALRQVVLRDIPVLRPPDSASAHPPVPAA